MCVEVATVNEISHIIQSSISFFFCRNRLSREKGEPRKHILLKATKWVSNRVLFHAIYLRNSRTNTLYGVFHIRFVVSTRLTLALLWHGVNPFVIRKTNEGKKNRCPINRPRLNTFNQLNISTWWFNTSWCCWCCCCCFGLCSFYFHSLLLTSHIAIARFC